jgi:hypothetical protein
MMTCKDASRLISEGQERPLKLKERWSLGFHLWLCDNCRRFKRQLGFLRHALHLLGRHVEIASHGPNLSPEAKGRIRRVLLDQDRPSN